MTHITCRLTTKNRDQLWNPTFGNRVLATFTFFTSDYLRFYVVSEKKPIYNPLAHPTWKCTTLTCEVPNFFYLTEGLHCTCIFRTCVFHPCRFVLAFSVHAFSILAKCAVSYLPFPYLRFPVLAFSAPPPRSLWHYATLISSFNNNNNNIPAAAEKRAPLLPMSGGLTANKSTRAVNAATHTAVSDFLPYFNSLLFMRAVLYSTDTRKLNPSNPGFWVRWPIGKFSTDTTHRAVPRR